MAAFLCVVSCDKHKDSGGKMAENSNSCSSSGKAAAKHTVYAVCMRDGVQQTAMQHRKMGVRVGHITFSV